MPRGSPDADTLEVEGGQRYRGAAGSSLRLPERSRDRSAFAGAEPDDRQHGLPEPRGLAQAHPVRRGCGFVSFEFAHIAARAGAAPVIVDRGARPLSGFDPDLVEMLIERSADCRRGGATRNRDRLDCNRIRRCGFCTVEVKIGRRTSATIETDLVVHGAGRIAALADLNLEAAGVAYGDKGIIVAPHLQSTTNSAVFAAGDSADTKGMPLTPVAVIEGKVAASNMLKNTQTAPDYGGIPTAVFTVPELARVGMLEAEAKEAGHDVDVRFTDTGGWYLELSDR